MIEIGELLSRPRLVYLLSSAIVNFFYFETPWRLTEKFKILTTLENSRQLLAWIQNEFREEASYLSSLSSPYRLLFTETNYFVNLRVALTRKVLRIENVFWRFNFVLSLKYWFFRSLNLLLDLKSPNPPRFSKRLDLYLNPHLLPSPISNVNLKSQFYKVTLLTLLQLLLSFWPKWNRTTTSKLTFLYSFPEFSLLPFINSRIFKTYLY